MSSLHSFSIINYSEVVSEKPYTRNDVQYYIGTLLGDVDERYFLSFQVITCIEYGAPYPLGNGASVGHFPVDCSSPPTMKAYGDAIQLFTCTDD